MLQELATNNRSYRSYDATRIVTVDELTDLVSCARLSASSNNRQFLRFKLCTEADMSALLPCLKWAAALPDWHLPPEGHAPTAAIVLCHDTTVIEDPRASLRDQGIKAQTMLLRATEIGLGGCMIANFTATDVAAALHLPAHLIPVLVVAVGKPDETVLLEDCAPGAQTAYYRDENGVHHVPKRTLDELIIQ